MGITVKNVTKEIWLVGITSEDYKRLEKKAIELAQTVREHIEHIIILALSK